jgi:hypothetical protein
MRHIIKPETFDKIVSLERYGPRAIDFYYLFQKQRTPEDRLTAEKAATEKVFTSRT